MDLSSDILTRAKSLFTKCGVKSITMDDLAKGMGISKKTLYEKIDSKASLVEQMVLHHIRDEKKALVKIKSQSANAVEEMILIARYVIQLLQQVSPNVIFEIKKYYWESWKKLEKLNHEHIHSVIQQNLKLGIEQGFYRSDLSIEIISRHYVTLASTIMDMDLFPPHQFAMDLIFKETILYHLRGITTPVGWEMCLKHFTHLDNNKI
ncbi:MAG: TetR/AcrR family transcriptional regulator [Saprospiraceae bacterium]